MKRLLLAPMLLVVLACPRDKQEQTQNIPIDTAALAVTTPPDSAPGDLSGVRSAIPAAAPDTFREQKLTPPRSSVSSRGGDVERESGAPAAPEPLIAAVEREQGFSRFCFTEFGKKTDPELRGNVTMLVTVGSSGVTDAKVGSSRWSGNAGAAVNRCLNERAERAWKLTPGSVAPGRYSVRLSFTG
jgi:hypothetical protein